MTIRDLFLEELKGESVQTKKMLERVPFDQPDWKPHDKSMTIQRLASHVADIPVWMNRVLESDHFDFMAAPFTRFLARDSEELLSRYTEWLGAAITALEKSNDQQLLESWTMKRGEHTIYTMPKYAAIRRFVLNHTVHHRGQLSVYLRLNNVPVPGMYGPSADER